MKKLIIIIIPTILAFFIVGCTATITIPDVYNVRIVNQTGETIKVRWDDGSYYYVENECILIISSVDSGSHELSWKWDSPSRRSKEYNIYKLEVDANFEIVINDDPDEIIIRWD
ncbi:MAG: hypothetical protein ACPL7B_00810 [Candidatus Poribacteria bacterium]